ncbi:hypothetical protein ENBRE01_3364 [Enteropsectra breve]|nr:hypothetical protein ENBRE01_3364 [Enteropsectra breve]
MHFTNTKELYDFCKLRMLVSKEQLNRFIVSEIDAKYCGRCRIEMTVIKKKTAS